MKRFHIEFRWAIYFAIMMLAWMLLERLTGLHDKHIARHAIFTNLIAIPAITIYVLALLDVRRHKYNGQMTYSQGFISGLIITAIVTIFSPLLQYLTSEVISPEYFRNMIAFAVSEGRMSQEEADAFFNLRSYIGQVLVGTPVMGIFTTAIVAIFTRKTGKNQ
ncbi:MAG: DUF4199 domain-containing protein [Bacteroidetes bacterium]|nr:DUF4199 domain-containing protein [Bacteroidota bacterium]